MQKKSERWILFSSYLDKSHRKYLRVLWKSSLYKFLFLCFGLGPAHLILKKQLKVPIALLYRPNIGLIIYLDDIIIMVRTLQELIFHRDTVTYPLQNLGFALDLKKSVLEPSQAIEFIVVIIDSVKMLCQVCQVDCTIQANIQKQGNFIMELTRLLGKSGATAQSVLPAKLQIRYLQRLQVNALKFSDTYQAKLQLDREAQEELFWWIRNLALSNGRSLILPPPDLLMTTNATSKE